MVEPLFGRDEIERLIPHREPFILVDAVLEFEANSRIKTVKKVRPEEWWFAGHFPSNPIMPGVLIIEHMAQSANVLVARSAAKPGQMETSADPPIMFLGMVNKARFLHPVQPGDELHTVVTAVKLMSTMGIVEAESFVGETCVAKARLQFGAMNQS